MRRFARHFLLACMSVFAAPSSQASGCAPAAADPLGQPSPLPDAANPSDQTKSDHADAADRHLSLASRASCLLTPGQLLGSDQLVDLRSKVEQGIWSIPGAMQDLPLNAQTVRAFKTSRVVLVGAGHNPDHVIRRCEELRSKGLDHVHVLAGGVVSLALDTPAVGHPVLDSLMLVSSNELNRLAASGAEVLSATKNGEPDVWSELLRSEVRRFGSKETLEPAELVAGRIRVILLPADVSPNGWLAERSVSPMAGVFFYNGTSARFRQDRDRASRIAAHAYKPWPDRGCGP
jgi:hypothetical protein